MHRNRSSGDSDSSPSTSSSSSGDENVPIADATLPMDPNTDPESPNAAHQSSDESGSSDGVLVELPGNNDQDFRSLPVDSDTGILVNFDGSMQEQQEREDLFSEASDHLGSGGRTPKLGESVAIVEVGGSSAKGGLRDHDLEHFQERLKAYSAECRKYKEEREAFGREVVAIRSELQDLIRQKISVGGDLTEFHQSLEKWQTEHEMIASSTPLHSMVKDCSRFVACLKSVLDERLNNESVEVNAKDQEIEFLTAKILESNVIGEVLSSYLGSISGDYSQTMNECLKLIKSRLLASIPVMDGTESFPSEDFVDVISLIEKRTIILVEKHNWLSLEVEELGQCLEKWKPGFLARQDNDLGSVLSAARKVLLENQKREGEFEERIRALEEENNRLSEQIIGLNKYKEGADSEMGKLKTELEQTEKKFVTTKEKLSIAVAKGKQLVQNRDSLKLLLAEKTTELDNCVQELQQKTNALETMESSNEELKQLLSVKTCGLEECLQELQEKTDILRDSRATIEELEELFQEKTVEYEKCFLELQLKSDAINMTNTNAEEFKQLLVENKDQLEKCLMELQQKSKDLETAVANFDVLKEASTEKNCELDKCLLDLKLKSDALEIAEATVQQLKRFLVEKDIELEKCLMELQEKAVLTVTTLTVSKELNEMQKLVLSLQDLAAYRDNIIKDIEAVTHDIDFPQDLSLDVVGKVRWLETKMHISDEVLQENFRAKNALLSVGMQDPISSAGFDSQIDWLVRSFNQTKEELSRLQCEITHASTLHESEVSETLKEVDRLAESLLKEKKERETLLTDYEDLNANHEKLAEKLVIASSEKEKFILFLKALTNLDDLSLLDLDTLMEKSIAFLMQKMGMSLKDGKKFENMQMLLYAAHVELALYEKILEELLLDASKTTSISDKLVIALEEVYSLRNEKESMEKELERLEEKNLLIRDKLSMAVKKGKGLVQDREGLKHTLVEKISEIEKMKEELQLQESKICEYREQIKSLFGYQDEVLKLEVDIASLKDKREQTEHLLNESNGNLKKLADSIDDISLYTDKIFETPIDKVYWIGERINEIEKANTYLELEIEKVNSNAALNSNRLTEVLDAMKSLEMELHNKDKCIHDFYIEKNDIQISKIKAEEELQKVREESFMQENKLADAYVIMKSLEDALLLAENKVFALDAEKNEFVSKSNMEISALNAKVAECMNELIKTRSCSENQLEELFAELKRFKIFMKNEGLLPLMFEHFHKKIEGLRHMLMLVQDIHDNFVAKAPLIHPEMEPTPAFANFCSLEGFEDFINNENLHTEDMFDDAEVGSSCKKFVENMYEEAKVLNDRFTGLSSYMDDHITFLSQALQATKDEFFHTLNFSESMKLNVENLETRNHAQEFEISSLRTESLILLTACSDATLELQATLPDLLGFDSNLEDACSGLDMRFSASLQGKLENEDVGEFAQAANKLLFICRKVTSQFQNLVIVNKDMSVSLESLKHKLNLTEMTAATAIDEKKLIEERGLMLEEDMDELQRLSNEMKANLLEYQSREGALKDKEMELKKLEHSLTCKDRGDGDEMISKDQAEVLFDNVNKLIILDTSSHLSASQSQVLYFSSPINKLFYVIDKFSEFQQQIDSLSREKEDFQLILTNHASEIEILKNSAESVSTNYRDLELKKQELSEVTTILERIMQKLVGKYSFEDLKPVGVSGLLRALERQILILYENLENSNSQVNELGDKLHAKDMIVNELSAKFKHLEDSHARIQQSDTVKERAVFESSSSMMRPEIIEIDEASAGISSKVPAAASAAHVRTTKKGSSDHLVLNIDSELSEHLINTRESHDKGHVFKSLSSSGMIPRQGRLIADRVDGIWVSGGRILMSKPGARLGLIGYWIFLHLWLLGSFL